MSDLPKPKLRPRRILERPRLLRALDRSAAAVRMLVAPPGFGKTTLAEQWSAQDGRRTAWVRARRSSADVAVLARQVAAAGAEIIAGCDRRLSERLNATQDPAQEVGVLVDLLSEDLADWPRDAWLVVDDYQHLAESPVAESFLEGVIQKAPVQVLIGTRDRPGWVSPRSVLYGEVLEIGQSMLAMSDEEVDEMLAGGPDAMSPGLLALAGGWPAVIGLASLSTTEPALPTDVIDLPEQLYEFFAEEVYRGLEADVRTGLGLLATAPSLDRELAVELLGRARAERVCSEALRLGVLEERGGKLELHPLAAAFLEERAKRESTSEMTDTALRCLATYRRRLEWDAAFELAGRFGTDADIETLFSDALDSLLNAARLATVETWIRRAEGRQLSSSTINVAKAEIALRDGNHMSAQAFAELALSAVQGDSLDAHRAAMVAGRSAHAGSREDAALGFYRLAEEVARTPRDVRDARSGQLMCASALESPEASALLELLEASTDPSDPFEAVRMADRKLGMDFRLGAIRNLGNARQVAELATHVTDPFVRCSFRCVFACALNLSAQYEEARDAAVQLLGDATEFRVDPALPYAHLMIAAAHAGCGEHSEAHRALDEAAREARRCHDEFGLQAVYASRVRILVQEGRALEACVIEPPDIEASVRSMKGEVLASRGLALATVGRLDEARAMRNMAIASTSGVEARVLAVAIDAVCAVNGRQGGEIIGKAERLVDIAFDAGAVDLVVTSYRGNPDLLTALLLSSQVRERALYIVARSGDESLVRAIGRQEVLSTDPVERLSVRERQVYELLAEGLSNKEIARHLFISIGTVKVHVHHVFDKLGIRSRTALAMNAARDRWRQAASASGSEGAIPSDPLVVPPLSTPKSSP